MTATYLSIFLNAAILIWLVVTLACRYVERLGVAEPPSARWDRDRRRRLARNERRLVVSLKPNQWRTK